MSIKNIRLVLKACAEDTRLRILNLLSDNELSVKEICRVLEVSQSVVSKHLARLRMLKLVTDRRQGNLVYYRLTNDKKFFPYKVIAFLDRQFQEVKSLEGDRQNLKKLRRK